MSGAIGWLAPMMAVACGGCAIGPTYRPAGAPALGLPAAYQGAAASGPALPERWWTMFGDPALTALEARALVANTDMAQAVARLSQAREGVVQAKAMQSPSVAASHGVGRNFNGDFPDTTGFSARLTAQSTPDLFGALGRAEQAAVADLQAARFSLADVQRTVASQLALNFIDARTFAARLAIARDTLHSQEQNLSIARFRLRAGLVSSLDVEQARSQRAQTRSTIAPLEQAEAQARYRVAVLAGDAPGAIDEVYATTRGIPSEPALPPTGVPADLLRRRPDVRFAERQLAASVARIGVARAQLYPALTLTGSFGSQSTSLRTLTDVITGSVLASLAQTIFDAGRMRSVVRQRRAIADERFAAYRGSLLGAIEDVENALAARRAADERAQALADQVQAATVAAALARGNYRAGLTDFRTLLDAERTLLGARDAQAAVRGDQASSAVRLVSALGGSWADAATTASGRGD